MNDDFPDEDFATDEQRAYPPQLACPPQRACPQQLAWVAFCYAADDLPAAEAAEFEQRLASDQSAREALAAAVELSQVVAAAESHPREKVSSPAAARLADWNSRLSWMAVGGLASALLVVLSVAIGPRWQAAQRNMRSAALEQLAFAWNETRLEVSQVNDQVNEVGFSHAILTADFDAESDMLADMRPPEGEFTDGEAPSWLTVAVLLAHDQPAHDSPAAAAGRLEN